MNIRGWFPSGLIDLNLLSIQETLRSLLQLHNSKASILQCSAFFMVQLSHLYMTTGKTTALTTWTFVGKLMSRLFSVLSRFVVAFLLRSKLISWLQSPSAMILEPKKIKSVTDNIISQFWTSPLFCVWFWLLLFDLNIDFSGGRSVKWKWKSLSRVRLFGTPWTIQSVEFSRPKYWSG